MRQEGKDLVTYVTSIPFRHGNIVMYMEWESDLYDFSNPEVRLKYVPQLGCSVGAQSLCCANRGSRIRLQGAKVMKTDVLS